jgi:hypothetical protein
MNAADRRRDKIALGFLGVGAFLYGAAFLGMHTMAVVPIVPVPGHPAIAHFTRLWLMSLAGLALIGVGGVAMAWSFGRFHARRHEAP